MIPSCWSSAAPPCASTSSLSVGWLVLHLSAFRRLPLSSLSRPSPRSPSSPLPLEAGSSSSSLKAAAFLSLPRIAPQASTSCFSSRSSSTLQPKASDRFSFRQKRTLLATSPRYVSTTSSSRRMQRNDSQEGRLLLVESSSREPREKTQGRKRRQQGKNKKFIINRPGRNAYLKVELDGASLDRLHRAVLTIRDRVDAWQQQQAQPRVASATTEAEGSSNRSDNEPQLDRDGAFSDNDDESNHNDTIISAASDDPRDDSSSSRSPLSVRPRSRHSLHLTLLFGGEGLGRLPRDELVKFHSRISDVLLGPGLFELVEGKRQSSSKEPPNEIGCGDADFWKDPRHCFRIVGLRTFPPRRNNLIVAVLEAPETWKCIHGSILQCASSTPISATLTETSTTTTVQTDSTATESNGGPCSGNDRDDGNNNTSIDSTVVTLEDIGAMNPPRWIPHVTLANVVTTPGGSGEVRAAAAQRRELDELLRQETQRLLRLFNEETGRDASHHDNEHQYEEDEGDYGDGNVDVNDDDQSNPVLVFPTGIAMGGPVPPQAPLDWTFRFCPRREEEKKRDVEHL